MSFVQSSQDFNYPGQLSAESSSTGTLYCLISVHWLELFYEMATFYRFAKALEENLDENG